MKIHSPEFVGSVSNFQLETVSSIPAFDINDKGRMFVFENRLYFNNGVKYITFKIAIDETDSNSLLNTFGELVNSDFSLNSNNINSLDNIENVTGDSTLFDVFVSLDNIITLLTNKTTPAIFNTVSAETVHHIQHDLSNQYPSVTVVDLGTNTTILNAQINFQSENALKVYLPEAKLIKVIVYG